MTLDNDARDLENKANNAYQDGKKDVKDTWADTKAGAEKAKNAVEADIDKL